MIVIMIIYIIIILMITTIRAMIAIIENIKNINNSNSNNNRYLCFNITAFTYGYWWVAPWIFMVVRLLVDILIHLKGNPPSNCLIIQVKIVLVVIFATTIEFYMKMNLSTFTDKRAPFTMPATAFTLGFKAYHPSAHLILSQFQTCDWSGIMIVVEGCGEPWRLSLHHCVHHEETMVHVELQTCFFWQVLVFKHLEPYGSSFFVF